jgi:hypothetical protein
MDIGRRTPESGAAGIVPVIHRGAATILPMTEKSRATKRKGEHIVRFVASLSDGTHTVEHPDGRLERRKGETDWKKLDSAA